MNSLTDGIAYNIDYDLSQLDGGGPPPVRTTSTPPNSLCPSGSQCIPDYPHDFLRTNTIMEVAHAAGRRTAWSDQHPASEIVGGPSGKGLDGLSTVRWDGCCKGCTQKESPTRRYSSLPRHADVTDPATPLQNGACRLRRKLRMMWR